jgi:hypothetical protein
MREAPALGAEFDEPILSFHVSHNFFFRYFII